MLQHDLSAIQVEVGEAFIEAVEDHGEPAQVTPKPQTRDEIGHQEFGD
jgi:hypothetical protein